jgi:hypothetical protein
MFFVHLHITTKEYSTLSKSISEGSVTSTVNLPLTLVDGAVSIDQLIVGELVLTLPIDWCSWSIKCF